MAFVKLLAHARSRGDASRTFEAETVFSPLKIRLHSLQMQVVAIAKAVSSETR
jgi:hypothetical protein